MNPKRFILASRVSDMDAKSLPPKSEARMAKQGLDRARDVRSGEEIEESADTREPRGNNRGGGGGKSSDRAPRDSGPRSYSDASSGGFGGTFGDLFKKKK